MELWEKIKTKRMALGMSQKKLAEKVKVSMSTVRRWEDAKRKPNFDEIISLAVALRSKPAYLLGETDEDELTADPRIFAKLRLREIWRRNHPGEMNNPFELKSHDQELQREIDKLSEAERMRLEQAAAFDDNPLREASMNLLRAMNDDQLRKAYEYLRDQKQLAELLKEKGA